MLVTKVPVAGTMAALPEIAATSMLPPTLIWQHRSRRKILKIVAKQAWKELAGSMVRANEF